MVRPWKRPRRRRSRPAGAAGDLEGRLDGLGAGVAEEHPCRHEPGGGRARRFGERERPVRGVEVARVPERGDLPAHRLDDPRDGAWPSALTAMPPSRSRYAPSTSTTTAPSTTRTRPAGRNTVVVHHRGRQRSRCVGVGHRRPAPSARTIGADARDGEQLRAARECGTRPSMTCAPAHRRGPRAGRPPSWDHPALQRGKQPSSSARRSLRPARRGPASPRRGPRRR